MYIFCSSLFCAFFRFLREEAPEGFCFRPCFSPFLFFGKTTCLSNFILYTIFRQVKNEILIVTKLFRRRVFPLQRSGGEGFMKNYCPRRARKFSFCRFFAACRPLRSGTPAKSDEKIKRRRRLRFYVPSKRKTYHSEVFEKDFYSDENENYSSRKLCFRFVLFAEKISDEKSEHRENARHHAD